MAGPNEDDHKAGLGNQTGTRPKSRRRTNTSLGSVPGGGSQSALLCLMREYQAVTGSLALARDQIEREGQRMVSRNTRDEDRLREIESLRCRLMELEMETGPVNTEMEAQPSLESDNFFSIFR